MRNLSFLFIILTTILLMSTISGQLDILKPAKVNQSYNILQTCATCTSINITISNVNGIITSNQPMTNNGSGVWNYSFTPTEISRHDVTGVGDLDGSPTSFATYFEVTPSGKVASTGDSMLYIMFSAMLFGLIFSLAFFVFTMPKRNERDDSGMEYKIVKVKYIRIFFIALIYPLTILLLNFLNGLAVNFSALTMFAGILGFMFSVMLSLAWIFTVIIIIWIVVLLIHDTNVNKQIDKLYKIRF